MSTPVDRDLGSCSTLRNGCATNAVSKNVLRKFNLFRDPISNPPPPAAPPNVEEDGVPHWLAPNLTPEGPPVRRRSTVGMIVCFLLAMAVPAIAAPFAASKFRGAETMTTTAERSNETPSFEARFWEQKSNAAENPRPPSAQLSVNQGSLRNQGEVCPLAATVDGSVVGASVIVDGLASGSTLSVGLRSGTNRWQLAAADLEKALVRPPEGFVGRMDIVLELRLADNTLLDRKPLRLEWAAAEPQQSTGSPIRQLDPREIADLIKRGERFISAGDLASARLVLQRAAEAGDPQAALMRRGPMIRSYLRRSESRDLHQILSGD